MESTLQKLLEKLKARFPNELPPMGTRYDELIHLQGNQEVIEYIESFVVSNQEEIDRDGLLESD